MSLFIQEAVLGFGLGLLAGLFGFGGSSVATPLLRMLFRIPPYIALGSPLPVTLVSSFIGTAEYQRNNLVKWNLVLLLAITVVPGSIIGAYLTKYISGKALMYLTGLFLVYVSFRFMRGEKAKKKEKKLDMKQLAVIGFFIGIISGLLANGGGIFIVPALVLLGLNIKESIATSLAMVLIAVTPSIGVHWYLGHIDWLVTAALIVGMAPGTWIGSKVMVKTEIGRLERWYGFFLLLISIYFIIFEAFLD